MISSKNIRFHAPSNTYIIPKNSVVDQNISVNGNIIVGPGCRFWKNIKADGNVQFGKGCVVEGDLKANQVVVGSFSKIKGSLIAESDVILLQNSAVRFVESKSAITVMPECLVGYANGSTLQVIGKAEIKKIGTITKVTVRADTVAEIEDEFKDSENDLENKDSEIIIDGDIGPALKAESDISKEEDFKNKSFDEENIADCNHIGIENNTVRESDSYSSSTPLFQVEPSPLKHETAVEKSTDFDESLNVEILEQSDKKSEPLSFLPSLKKPQEPVNVPADETEEVEIMGEVERPFSNNAVLQTVETPFGTIVVGEHSLPPANKTDENAFASLIENSEEEAPERQKQTPQTNKKPGHSNSQTKADKTFAWPTFEPQPTKKTGKEEAETQSKSNTQESAPQTNMPRGQESAPQTNMPRGQESAPQTNIPHRQESNVSLNSRIQYEELPNKRRENLKSASGDFNFQKSIQNFVQNFVHNQNRSQNSDSKLIFEEIGKAPSKSKKDAAFGKQEFKKEFDFKGTQNERHGTGQLGTGDRVKQHEAGQLGIGQFETGDRIKQHEAGQLGIGQFETGDRIEQQKAGQNIFSKSEEQLKTRTDDYRSKDIEKSKVWYEDRYQEIKPRKKEYPPYI